LLQYNFDWDPNKARNNLKKHGVSFERAAEIFLDPSAISILDKEHWDQEERWVPWGRIPTALLCSSFILFERHLKISGVFESSLLARRPRKKKNNMRKVPNEEGI